MDQEKIGIYSYGSSYGTTSTQFEVDVTALRDPAGQKQFVNLNGSNPSVREWIKTDSRIPHIINQCLILADDLVKEKSSNGKDFKSVSPWLSIGFKDHHGKYIAPAVAELVGEALRNEGYKVIITHYQLQSGSPK